MQKGLFISILLLLGVFIQAQDRKMLVSATTGLTTPILDNGLGLHLGINPAYLLSPHFLLEGQLSYLYTRIGASFLSGKEGNSHAFNTLVGGRVYLNAAENRKRVYLNFLLGANYTEERINQVSSTGNLGLGWSAGTYLEWNKYLLGLSYDTPQNLVLKLGYILQ